MRIDEYTINVGGYDPLRDFGMMCLDDVDLFSNNARNSRLPKILVHKYVKADVSIYWDANKTRVEGMTKERIVEEYLGDADILVTYHPRTLDEEIVNALRRVNCPKEKAILEAQGHHYKRLGLLNLNVCGFQPLVRRHSQKMSRFNEAWWAEMCRWSYRDQVSFPVIAQQFPEIKLKHIDLGDICKKLYSHGSKTFPKINKDED